MFKRNKCVFKISFPNGKIYIGKDLIGLLHYYGSPGHEHIEQDFSNKEAREFTITKTILWSSETATDKEVNNKEVQLIRKFKSNNPAIGYNRWPKFRKD